MKFIASLIINVLVHVAFTCIFRLVRQIQLMSSTLLKQQLMLIFSRPAFAFCVRPNVADAMIAMTLPAISAQQATIFTLEMPFA